MLYGRVITKSLTTGDGGSMVIDLGSAFKRVYFHSPDPGGAIDVQASLDGENYGALAYPTGQALSGIVSILSTYSNQVREIPGSVRFYKFISTLATGSGTNTIRLWGTDV